LEDLQKNLVESGELIRTYENIITERENLLRDLQNHVWNIQDAVGLIGPENGLCFEDIPAEVYTMELSKVPKESDVLLYEVRPCF
jgi:hypothetical protein